jgi:tetratricopeptide (TPR) repeat protein
MPSPLEVHDCENRAPQGLPLAFGAFETRVRVWRLPANGEEKIVLYLNRKTVPLDIVLLQTLDAVDGYLYLDMPREALRELNEVSIENQLECPVLLARIRVLLQSGRWKDAEILSKKGAILFPDENEFFVQRAFALHQLDRTDDALGAILSAPDWIHRTGILHYNLACYEARHGDVATARNCVDTALKLNSAFRKTVRTDPDLQPLWQ